MSFVLAVFLGSLFLAFILHVWQQREFRSDVYKTLFETIRLQIQVVQGSIDSLNWTKSLISGDPILPTNEGFKGICFEAVS